jgi:hypothetical protein
MSIFFIKERYVVVEIGCSGEELAIVISPFDVVDASITIWNISAVVYCIIRGKETYF